MRSVKNAVLIATLLTAFSLFSTASMAFEKKQADGNMVLGTWKITYTSMNFLSTEIGIESTGGKSLVIEIHTECVRTQEYEDDAGEIQTWTNTWYMGEVTGYNSSKVHAGLYNNEFSFWTDFESLSGNEMYAISHQIRKTPQGLVGFVDGRIFNYRDMANGENGSASLNGIISIAKISDSSRYVSPGEEFDTCGYGNDSGTKGIKKES